jgi:predicted nucleic acid-binding Zn ribbon protein
MNVKRRIPRIIHQKRCMVCEKEFTAHKSNAKCCSPQCHTSLKYARHSPAKTFIGELTGFVSEKGKDCFYREAAEKLANAAGCPWNRVFAKVDRRDPDNKPIFKLYCLVA